MNTATNCKSSNRPATWNDISAIVELANRAMYDQWGKQNWTVEEAVQEYSVPGYDINKCVRLWHDAEGRHIGTCQVNATQTPPVRPVVIIDILPGYDLYLDLGTEMLAWGEALVRDSAIPRCPANARVIMTSWTYHDYAPYVTVYEAYGMRRIRQYLTMEITLDEPLVPPKLPADLSIRAIHYPEESRDLYRITDEAFRDHYGYVADSQMKNYDEWVHNRFNAHNFDPSLWFVAEVNGQYAGIAFCHIESEDEGARGWIRTLGVLPAYRRRGIATYLLRHAFYALHRHGMHKAGLEVDATNNTGANRLYERAGMHAVAGWDTFAKILRDGDEIAQE